MQKVCANETVAPGTKQPVLQREPDHPLIARAWSRAISLIICMVILSCGHKNSPEGVSDAFLFRYFLELNQRGALELSTGLAVDKLKKEIELTQSVRMQPNLDLSQHRPFIDYKLLNMQAREDKTVTLFYDVIIEQKSGDKYHREAVLSAVQVDGVWKINNFDIFDRRREN